MSYYVHVMQILHLYTVLILPQMFLEKTLFIYLKALDSQHCLYLPCILMMQFLATACF